MYARLLLCIALSLPACSDARPEARGATTAALATTHEPVWHDVRGLRVLEVTRGPRDAKLPAVVILHGRGDVAHTGWIEGFEVQARYFFPQAPLPFGDGYSWFHYSASAGVDKLAEDIAERAEQLAGAIETLTDDRPTQGKPIVSGFSQGAMLSYALALLHPERIAQAVPVAGLLPQPLYADLPKSGVRYPPIFALHGTEDTLVPFDLDATMVQRLQTKGMHVNLQEYPGVRHSLRPEMRAYMLERIRAGIDAQRAAH
jgi:phospholipase/carboxylesterase